MDFTVFGAVALEMMAYPENLQQLKGLFYHAPDAPFCWGRGMTELLPALPIDHPQRAGILRAYRKMMQVLLGYQGQDGMWRN